MSLKTLTDIPPEDDFQPPSSQLLQVWIPPKIRRTKNVTGRVQLDHEHALQFAETRVIKEIAPSFIDLLNNVVTKGNV